MKGVHLFVICMICLHGMWCHSIAAFSINANTTIISSFDVEMWRMDNTLHGASVRTARRLADDIFVRIDMANLPAKLPFPEMPSDKVEKMVMDFCNLSFKCEKVKECMLFMGRCEMYHSVLLVNKRVFIPPV